MPVLVRPNRHLKSRCRLGTKSADTGYLDLLKGARFGAGGGQTQPAPELQVPNRHQRCRCQFRSDLTGTSGTSAESAAKEPLPVPVPIRHLPLPIQYQMYQCQPINAYCSSSLQLIFKKKKWYISSIFDQQNYFLSYYFEYFTTIILLQMDLPKFFTGLLFPVPMAKNLTC